MATNRVNESSKIMVFFDLVSFEYVYLRYKPSKESLKKSLLKV